MNKIFIAFFYFQKMVRVLLRAMFSTPEVSTLQIYPIKRPFCKKCCEPFFGEIYHNFYCSNCAKREWSLDWSRAAYRSKSTVRFVIHDFKYRRNFFWLETMSDWLEEGFREYAAAHFWDGIVPVPLHFLRAQYRSFNQAFEIAKRLSARQSIDLINCLERPKATKKQSLLSRQSRLVNLKKVFKIKPRFDVRGKSLLIIDDVFTTGATVEACAIVLKKAGATKVAALTVARA